MLDAKSKSRKRTALLGDPHAEGHIALQFNVPRCNRTMSTPCESMFWKKRPSETFTLWWQQHLCHAGSSGTRGKENASIHFNVGMAGNNEDFEYWFLHNFDRGDAVGDVEVETKHWFKPGIVKPDGTLDMECLAEYGRPKVDIFKGLMIGWYPECQEWDGVQMDGNTPVQICDLETYMKSQHVAESSGSSGSPGSSGSGGRGRGCAARARTQLGDLHLKIIQTSCSGRVTIGL